MEQDKNFLRRIKETVDTKVTSFMLGVVMRRSPFLRDVVSDVLVETAGMRNLGEVEVDKAMMGAIDMQDLKFRTNHYERIYLATKPETVRINRGPVILGGGKWGKTSYK